MNAHQALQALPPYDPDKSCPKCGYSDVLTTHQANTRHYGCPLGAQLCTSFGPEHFLRTCQRCRYSWEERCA